MRVWKHGCDITPILIGYVLSDVRFDWLVGNMSVYQESLFQSSVFIASSIKHLGELEEFSTVMQTQDAVPNFPKSPLCLYDAMERKTSSSIA